MSQSERRGDPEDIVARAEELLHELDQPTPQAPSPSSAPIVEGKDRKPNNGSPAASSDLTSPSRNPIPEASSTARQPQAAKSDSPLLAITIQVGLLFVLAAAAAIGSANLRNRYTPTKTQTYTPPSADSDIDRIEGRLSTARERGKSAVLICEHQKVIDAFDGLDFSSASQSQVNEKNSLLTRAQGAIKALDAPGRHKYYEICDLGIGFQLYDQYKWETGNDYVGSFFGVASKKCAAPAIQAKAYRDKEYKQLLFSDWFPFTPDPATGIAKRVPFRIPGAKLPLEQFWYVFRLRC